MFLLLGNLGEERSFESLGCRGLGTESAIKRVKEQKKKKSREMDGGLARGDSNLR